MLDAFIIEKIRKKEEEYKQPQLPIYNPPYEEDKKPEKEKRVIIIDPEETPKNNNIIIEIKPCLENLLNHNVYIN